MSRLLVAYSSWIFQSGKTSMILVSQSRNLPVEGTIVLFSISIPMDMAVKSFELDAIENKDYNVSPYF